VKRAALVLIVAACGHPAGPAGPPPGTTHTTPPSCDALVAHLAVVFDQKDLAPADRHDLIASCEKDAPPPAERTCVMAAQTPAEVDACGKRIAGPDAPAAAAPADPKDDLVALGLAVAKYRAQLGEPPPAAGPTPPAATCCPNVCPADQAQWVGPWQLVRYGLDHPTRWSFEIVRPTDDAGAGPVTVRAVPCPGEPGYELSVAPGATPSPNDIVMTPAP
jgi:hypothetical protein